MTIPRWLKVLISLPLAALGAMLMANILTAGTWVVDPLVQMLPEWASIGLAAILLLACFLVALAVILQEWALK